MSLRNLLTQARARVAAWGQETVSGTRIGESIEIARLMCPLRLDLAVRVEFIRLLRDEWTLYTDDLPRFLERPESKAYYVWFRDVRCAHYDPELRRDGERAGAAFLERVHQTARLWQSMERNGYDRSTPIRLETGRSVRPVNEKAVASPYFTGDGCHRLSCLYLMNRTRLSPEDYEVRVHRVYQPLDITGELLPLLSLDRSSYLRFMSQWYAPGQATDTADDMVRFVSRNRPELLHELQTVFAYDLPLLTS
jgi:hypothetical protein